MQKAPAQQAAAAPANQPPLTKARRNRVQEQDLDAPAEQLFDKIEDAGNFSLLDGPDPDDVLTLSGADRKDLCGSDSS